LSYHSSHTFTFVTTYHGATTTYQTRRSFINVVEAASATPYPYTRGVS